MKSSKRPNSSKNQHPAGQNRRAQTGGDRSEIQGKKRPAERSASQDRKRTGERPVNQDRKRTGERPAPRDIRRTSERPAFESKTRQSERSPVAIRSHATTSTGISTTQRQFHIWGRRPIENYLASLQQDESLEQKSHALHVIADKAGRVPAQLKNIVEPCKSLGFKITLCKSQEDEEWPLTSEEQLNHQRVCLRVPRIPTVTIHDIAQSLPDMMADTPHGCLGLVLDQVQDPRNFGAILRTAAFFGAKFVVFGEDRQAEITPLVVKTSSGGAFSLQLVPTVNINRALEILKKSGVWVIGSSLQASARHDELPMDRHYVLVVGNESKGMRQEVARHCDYLVKIPGGVASVDSLNVGVATGVLLSTLQAEMSRRATNTFQSGELGEE
ncbi:23S rRNA (guanosine(2251)-2'-O)-methyltransferase RlmB [bacterium]|nr:23S rRNA (guanosine(2251)-2'-O)-methyltransferase RlmB [bacterium]